MADSLSVIPANVLHNLSDKLYEKRKNAALEHGRKEINVELKKEAEYFGDIVIVPYMDNYDLVVLKTVAICEYGARFLAAKYIIKCDDDTFVRVGAVIKEAKKVDGDRSLYVGNMNYYHKPLRNGKWAVTYECRNVIVLAAANITELEEEWGCLIEVTKSCGLWEVVEPYVSKCVSTNLSEEVSRIESAIEALRKKLPPGTLSKTK